MMARFQEFSFLDWHGKISAVIFFSGCNMRCGYCHNHLLANNAVSHKDFSYDYIVERLETLKGWVDGVVVSGGEPTLNRDLFFLLDDLKKSGFKTKLDTNGSFPSILSKVVERGLVDCVALDVKAPMNPFLYGKAAGVNVDTRRIKESIDILMSGGVDYHFRLTLAPILPLSAYKELIAELENAQYLIIQKFRPGEIMDESLNKLPNFSDKEIKDLALFASGYVEKVSIAGAQSG